MVVTILTIGGGLDNVGSINYTFTSKKSYTMLQILLSAALRQEKRLTATQNTSREFTKPPELIS
jgi:hypothetical protein